MSEASSSSHVRIIIVEDVELEGKLAIRLLADRGFSDVIHAKDVESAMHAIDDKIPCVILADFNLGGPTGIDLIKKVRSRPAPSPYVYCIMLTGKGNQAKMRDAFEAGADDFILKPFQPEELVARVHAAIRIVHLERSLFARAQELEAALRKIDNLAAGEAIARARARDAWRPSTAAETLVETVSWDRLSAVLQTMLAQFVGIDFSVSTITDSSPAAVVGEVFLSDAAHQLELGIAVVLSGVGMKKLTMQMFGEETDFESGCALILETANVLMGGVKTVLGEHNYEFTAGLPRQPDLAEARTAYDAHPVRQRFTFRTADDLEVNVWMRASERRNSRVKGKDLREGMVIAEDVHDDRGMLLVRGGVRLTQTTAERLANMIAKIDVVVSQSS
ncbi:MAG: response regulator [Deltaproteobacteria bacterium]|nr:response regulator [Deltaproteobacteria bacterium]